MSHTRNHSSRRLYLRTKLIFHFSSTELLSRSDIYGLEDCLPDELVSAGWEEVLGGNKPPAQGPGPGGMQQQGGGGGPQMNGGDDNGGNVVVVPPNVTMQRAMQQQQMAHHLMQQVSDDEKVVKEGEVERSLNYLDY